MEQKRGSSKVIADIVRMGARISVHDMEDIAETAEAAGGALVSVSGSDDDDWCGNGRIILKWPPKKDEFFTLLDLLVHRRINHEVLINGIPVPREVMINVSRQLGR
ncbi:MAG: hypothetical protein GY906_21070 [bacterium]|nr:hypothetical protein [bacterium]